MSSPCPLFLFSLLLLLSILLSLVFSISLPFFRSLKAVSFCFFVASPLCPLSSSFFFSLHLVRFFSSSFYSRRMRVFLVRQRASLWWGLSAVIRSLLDLEMAPLSLPMSPSLIITEHQLLQTKTWWKRRRLVSFDSAIEFLAALYSNPHQNSNWIPQC